MRQSGSDYRDVLEPGRRRKRMLYRALAACVLAAVLLLVVSVVGKDDEPASPAVAQRVEPQGLPPLALTDNAGVADGSGEAAPLAPDQQGVPEDDQAALDVMSDDIADDAAERGDEAVSMPEQQALAAAREASELTPVPPGKAPVLQPARPQSAPQAAPAALRHVVRVGDFSDPQSRQVLHDQIVADGNSATVQSRVAVGPFDSKDSADSARLQLERDRRMRGLVIRLVSGEHAVQLGVFSDAANADAMQDRLESWGYKVLRDARLLVGPFDQRDKAEAMAASIMLGSGEKTHIITGRQR